MIHFSLQKCVLNGKMLLAALKLRLTYRIQHLIFTPRERRTAMKVVIIDDEPKIIQLIRCLVNWDTLGMQVIGTLCDGAEALEAICRLRPDIVLTDIRMPNIDGIDLITRVHERGLFPYFIIISGYNDFSYAQKAVKLGVDDYLLKPIEKKPLEHALRKISEKYTEQQRLHEKEHALLSELQKTKERLKNDLLSDLILKNNYALLETEQSELEATYHCTFPGDLFCCLTAHLYTASPNQNAENEEIYDYILPRIKERLREILSEHRCEYLSVIADDEIIILIN